jgi:tartrate dehydrogenase/decarboxylase/D-malate dehydrogenase
LTTYQIPVIPGDGIGPEIIAEGRKVIDAIGETDSFEVEWIDYPHGAEHYLATGELIGEDTLKELRKYPAIYLGSLGDPRVEPGILELGILLRIRFYMDEYVNLRPIKLYEGIDTPLKDKTAKDINFTVVRENTEDFYVGLGSRVKKGVHRNNLELIRESYHVKFGIDVETDAEEIAYQLGVMSRHGARRVIKYAFDYAKDHNRTKVTAVDKANVITNMYGMWREIVRDVAKGYPGIEQDFAFVDATTMWFVKNPEWFQVVVTPNLFGDIITDLGAMIQGGLGFAAGGNINPDGTSMFEPIHGSAPKYKGMNRVNPLATILSGCLLLVSIGLRKSAEKVELAVIDVLKEGKVRTYDMNGTAGTSEMGDAIVAKIRTL